MMADLEFHMHDSSIPEGLEYDVGGILLVKNGEKVIVDEQQQAEFEQVYGAPLRDLYKDNPAVSIKSARSKGGDE